MSEAGTVAVSCWLLTKVVASWTWFGPAFHKRMAPVTKPAPFAVMVKSEPPAFAVWGLRNDRNEDDVWLVKFVLNWEQPPTKPDIASAAIIHLHEYIRTRSSPSHPCETPGRRKSCENNPRAEETSDDQMIGRGLYSYAERLPWALQPRWGEIKGLQMKRGARQNLEKPRQTGLFLIPPEPAQVNSGAVSHPFLHSNSDARRGLSRCPCNHYCRAWPGRFCGGRKAASPTISRRSLGGHPEARFLFVDINP
jgi:hypothetical protein